MASRSLLRRHRLSQIHAALPKANVGVNRTLRDTDRLELFKNGHICSHAYFVFSQKAEPAAVTKPAPRLCAKRKPGVQKSTAFALMIAENETSTAFMIRPGDRHA
jgi:hypothetical protein